MDRTCGHCSLCCKVLAVDSIPKGRGVWCPHASRDGDGCRVYDDRPSACRSWSCAWLLGHTAFLESDRPDLSGVVASIEGIKRIALHEAMRGSLETTQELAARLVASDETVLSVPISGRATVNGPQADEVRRLLARTERQRR